MSSDAPVTPKPAATILMCKNGPNGIETFMVVRNYQIDFGSGALVFPGGKLADSDSHPEVRGLCDGTDGLDDDALGLQVAAIREVFEECGILLAREQGSDAMIPGERLGALEHYRATLNTGEVGILKFLQKESLRLACDCLHPYAHWITPKMVPKRFNTHFFIAFAPDDHVAAHDGEESTDSVWISPEQVIREGAEGKWTLMFPTRLNLMMLGESGSVEEAIAAANARTLVTVEPWLEQDEGDEPPWLCIPPEAGYQISRERAERHLKG